MKHCLKSLNGVLELDFKIFERLRTNKKRDKIIKEIMQECF